MDVFVIINWIIVGIGIITIYCSTRLAIVLNKVNPSHWWYICPGLVLWGVINRLLVAMFSGQESLYIISALNLPWWFGITIFIHEIRVQAEKMLIKGDTL